MATTGLGRRVSGSGLEQKNAIDAYLKSVCQNTTTLKHWCFIAVKDSDFQERANCACCTSTCFIEALYETRTDTCQYTVRRFALDTRDLSFIRESEKDILKPKAKPHPYVGHKQLGDFFYNTFCKNRKFLLRRSNSDQRSATDYIVSIASSEEPSPIATPTNSPPSSARVVSFFGVSCKDPEFLRRDYCHEWSRENLTKLRLSAPEMALLQTRDSLDAEQLQHDCHSNSSSPAASRNNSRNNSQRNSRRNSARMPPLIFDADDLA